LLGPFRYRVVHFRCPSYDLFLLSTSTPPPQPPYSQQILPSCVSIWAAKAYSLTKHNSHNAACLTVRRCTAECYSDRIRRLLLPKRPCHTRPPWTATSQLSRQLAQHRLYHDKFPANIHHQRPTPSRGMNTDSLPNSVFCSTPLPLLVFPAGVRPAFASLSPRRNQPSLILGVFQTDTQHS